MQPETKICQSCEQQFRIDSDDFGFYEKMGVLSPKLCPDCRFKRRAQFRNETSLYSRKCDLCGKPILSVYHPKSSFVVYCMACYYSDKWEPRDYFLEYDSSRSFWDQLHELYLKVPKPGTSLSSFFKNVNSDYANFAGGKDGLRNCYMVFNGGGEDMMYTRGVRMPARNIVDGYYSYGVEKCYEIINTKSSFGVCFGQNVVGCLDSYFLYDCVNCQNCFGCVNLRNQSFCFLNKKLSKDEYQEKVNEILGSFSKMQKFRKMFDDFSLKFPRRLNQNLKAYNSFGNYLCETNNVFNGFEVAGAENCRNVFFAGYALEPMKDSWDVLGFGFGSELLLETMAVGYSSRVISSAHCWYCSDLEYCFYLNKSENCLGCDGIKNGKYFILNKQYGKNEFFKIKEEIVGKLKEKGEYGLFFPGIFFPSGYNETIAQDNFPLTKKEAIYQGFRWEDDIQKTEGKETLQPENIPDCIKDVPDFITGEVLKCVSCGRNYKIIQSELDFYRRMTLPIPRQCFFCRHKDRIRRRGEMALYDRQCDRCQKDIKTNYSLDRPEIVCCEECYKKEVL